MGSNGTIFANGKKKNLILNKDGYYQIPFITSEGYWSTTGHHRLVALAYVPNDDPINKTEVNHKDYNRKNNHPDNLEWVSHRDNVLYSRKHYAKYGSDNPNFGNKKLSQIYQNNPELALEKQSRKGIKNGRCRQIQLYYKGKYIDTFDYMELCIKYLQEHGVTKATKESVRGRIDASVRNNKPYKGYTFIKL